jgi:uncharacterized membrane protein
MWFFFLIGAVALFLLWRRTRRLEKAVAALTLRITALEPAPQPVAAPEPPPVFVPQPVAPRSADDSSARKKGADETSPVRKPRLDFEAMLGTNWLAKIGVAILVLGIAFFLAWQLRELGPAGKIVVGTVVSALLLGAGIWGERSQRYVIPARAALAGGWALLFFTAYAAHHIAAARVIHSPPAGFIVMLAVVAAMVAHTLRFKSPVVTGLAFSIAFATIALNRVDVWSLTANVALAIGFCFVVVRMQWFRLELLGIAATYINHFLWLIPIIAPMHGKVHPFPQFYASAAILILYWAVFRASYVVRPPVDEKTSAFAAVLNVALLGAVMKYQSAHPELAFWGILAIGMIELALAWLPNVRRKRTSFVVLSTIGAVLLVAAIPFRYGAASISPLWLLEAALLIFTGVAINERVYRRLGGLAGVATAVQLISVPSARILGTRFGGVPAVREWLEGSILLATMLILYAAAEWLPRKWPEMYESPIDRRMARALSYAAMLMGLIGGWALLPGSGAAVFWIALALVAAYAGRALSPSDLIIEADALALLATLRVLVINLPTNNNRLLTVALVAAGVYALSRWNRIPATTWAGSMLVALLAWYQLLPISVALAWTGAGIVLLEAGLARRSTHLQWQAAAMLGAAFLRIFIVNLNANPAARAYTILPIVVALVYAAERELRPWLSRAYAWLAAAAVLALLRFELPLDSVAVAWAALALLLVIVAQVSGRRVYLHIGLAVAVLTMTRAILHNLYERSWFPPPASAPRWIFVAGAAAILFATLPFAFRLRRTEGRWLDAHPEKLLFFAPLLLVTALLGTEMRKGMLTVAWGIEAVAVFLVAIWIHEKTYRRTGLALLLLCVGKIFVFDFWSLSLADKALTGIIVGVALIGVSILYTRKREAILQFL